MIARMWEVRGHAERIDELVSWVTGDALPTIEDTEGHESTQVYVSIDRVVVITLWHGEPTSLPEPPPELVARPPHSWDFTPVPR